jgi:hypothetical protein
MIGPNDRDFRRSTFSPDASVEVAQRRDGAITVRHAKNPGGPELVCTRDEWIAFVRGVKSGQFDFGMNIGAGVDSSTVRFSR